MYSEMLSEGGQQLLIKFVLKGRLTQSAKLRVESTYKTVSDMITDFRKKLLVKKSFTAIQKHIESISQGHKSINEYGSELEKLLTDLNISQADGNEYASTILKPINEKMVIKKFTDGLRSEKLSTIIAARNYSSLQDAIQAAKDESVPSSSAEVFRMTSTHRGRNNFSKYHRKGQSFQNFPENSYNNGRYSNHFTSKPPQSNFRGRFQNFRGNFNHYNKNVRYNHIKRNSYLVQNNNDQIQNSDRSGQKPPELDKKQFFRS
ncbi:hypothetical protein RR48_00944 [Papilio machaon]|uniref:Retrotransposon gag domain-containing protein n=1 Tax=Papilio machaon TaxID=76193 RepID=A0A0N1IEB5_PAPMA|nr:hypothetical protein RR48_00944 [Papilio machaon]